MKVILNTDIPNLGEEGDILDVKPGYARNYLLPNQLVLMHNRTNLAVLEGKRKQIEKRKEEHRKAAMSNKAKIDEAVVVIPMPAGENGKLFGAVTAQMIVDELEKMDITIERKKVEVPGHTLKAVGDYKVHIRLYNDSSADLKVKILRIDDKGNVVETTSAPKAAPEVVASAPVEKETVQEEVVQGEAPSAEVTEEDSVNEE